MSAAGGTALRRYALREAYESAVPECESLLPPDRVNCGSGRSPISVHTHAALNVHRCCGTPARSPSTCV